MNKTDVEQLFSVGDVLPWGGSENTLSIASILDDRILLRPEVAEVSEIGLEYSAIIGALSDSGGNGQGVSPMGCFISEYQRRVQIRHEERVDELWDSAAELFLGPVCSMNERTGAGNAPYCPFDSDFFLKR